MIEIRSEIQELLSEVRKNRRHLHANPELGLATRKTREYIVTQLRTYGFDILDEGMAENGVVAQLKVNDEKMSIGFRSDMDALPTKEENEVDFCSVNEYSHACGHDGHMAALLGLASYLSKHKDNLKENICFVFQPGEEGPGGAEKMMAEGLFQKFPMKYMIGTHLMGDVAAGYVASKEGPLMARNGEIEVLIHGKSAHGAMPHLGKDTIVAASHFITQVQSILSRNSNPMQSSVITFGKFHGGEARNVICEEVVLDGTLRSFDDDNYMLLKRRLNEIGKGIAEAFEVQVEVNVEDYYLIVDNDPTLNEILKEVSGDSYIEALPKMVAEDFSFYQKEIPGLFYYTGVRDEKHQQDIHNSRFNFDESVLLNSVEINVRLLEKLGVYHD